jgi:hypothetical protein
MDTTLLEALARELNDAWLSGRFDDLGDCFHHDAVIVAPDSSTRIVGRAACVASYREFMDSATVHNFDVRNIAIDVFGSAAMLAVTYEIDYEMPAGRWRGSGRDLLMLIRENHRWLVTWRTLIPGAEVAVTHEKPE